MKEEKILKKVDKLLKLYGVEDGEREKFLLDLKDKKYDDQEDIEEVAEGEEEIEEPNESEEPVEEESTEVLEEEPSEPVGEEEPVEEEVDEEVEEPVGEELPIEQVEEPLPEQPVEQPMEQPVMDQPQQPDQSEDLQNTIDGLQARIDALEDLVKKLGTPVEESVGVEPRNPSGESLQESEFDRINRLRRGR
jgi:hypothetical protein